MNKFLVVSLSVLVLAGCSGKTYDRDQCAEQSNLAWKELDLAKAEGFAGTVSYAKALSLLTAAKTSQQFEGFQSCAKNASKARFYIRESRAGR